MMSNADPRRPEVTGHLIADDVMTNYNKLLYNVRISPNWSRPRTNGKILVGLDSGGSTSLYSQLLQMNKLQSIEREEKNGKW